MANVVVVEDEDLVRSMILEVLRSGGHRCIGESDPSVALEKVREEVPDLIILDLNLPEKMRGLDLCRVLRRSPATSDVPIIVVTGNKEEEFEIALFDAGADDYIRKNDFQPKLFLSRIRAVLRRASSTAVDHMQVGPLSLHPARREAKLDGESVPFTPTEFDIVFRLMSQAERAHTRRELLDRGTEGNDPALDRTVDVHILSIRRKLGAASWLIATVWGVGYRRGERPG